MKKTLLLGLGACALALGGLGAFTGSFVMNRTASEVTADTTEYYYYRGDRNSWAAGTDALQIAHDGTTETWTFSEGEAFKFVSGADTWNDNPTTLSGNAASSGMFSKGDRDNIVCHLGGTYSLSFTGETLTITYVEGAKLYYAGTAHVDGSNWETYTDAPIEVGGSPVEFSFSADEMFKLKEKNTWTFELGMNNVDDLTDVSGTKYACYRCFINDGTNIKVRRAGNYNVSAVLGANGIKIVLAAAGATSSQIHVLDLNGDLLKGDGKSARVHAFDGSIATTEWPGLLMSKVENTNNLYGVSVWDALTTIQVNNGNSKTINYTLDTVKNKVLILSWSYDDKTGLWDSNTWVQLETAKFVDKYMKYETNHEDNAGSTAGCADNYSAAKAAYNDASFAAYRADFCGIPMVVERMQKWAIANHEVFTVTDGIGSFASTSAPMTLQEKQSDQPYAVIALIAAGSVAALGGLFLLRKKRAE